MTNFGDPSGQRHVGGRRRDTHTADKVLTHGHTLLFYIYRYIYIYIYINIRIYAVYIYIYKNARKNLALFCAKKNNFSVLCPIECCHTMHDSRQCMTVGPKLHFFTKMTFCLFV